MESRWRKAWSFHTDDWIDVWASELHLRERGGPLTATELGPDHDAVLAMWETVHPPGSLHTSGDPYFIARCAPGTWRLDLYEDRSEPGWCDIIEARLRRVGRPLVEWDWDAIVKKGIDRHSFARLYGRGDLNGGTFSFWLEEKVSAWLGEVATRRDATFRGLFEDSRGRPLARARRSATFFDDAGVALVAPGDVPYVVARVHHDWNDLELGWSVYV